MIDVNFTCIQFLPPDGGYDCTGYIENTSSTPLYVKSDIVVTVATTTQPEVYNGFTHGEIITSLFLFLIFMIGIFSLFWFGIIKPHIHRVHKK